MIQATNNFQASITLNTGQTLNFTDILLYQDTKDWLKNCEYFEAKKTVVNGKELKNEKNVKGFVLKGDLA